MSFPPLTFTIMDEYTKKFKDLLQAFKNANYPVSHMWIRRQEEKGNLILPRSTTDFKGIPGKRKGAVRKFTQRQIEQIVQAFLPGGTGFYDYRKI